MRGLDQLPSALYHWRQFRLKCELKSRREILFREYVDRAEQSVIFEKWGVHYDIKV